MQYTSNFGSGNSCGNKDQEKCIVVNTPLGRIPKIAIVREKNCKGGASETYTDEEAERSNGNNIVNSGPSPSPGPSVCDEVKERNTPKTFMVNTPGLQDDIEISCDKTFQNNDPSEAVKEDNRNEDETLVVLFADSFMPSLDRHEEKGKKLYKWNESLENLKSFVELILHRKGSWKGRTKTGRQTLRTI